METKKQFQIGDQVVWDSRLNGLNEKHRGRVANIEKNNESFQVYVDFGENFHEWFTIEGRWQIGFKPSLFHIEPFWVATVCDDHLEAKMPGCLGKVVIKTQNDGILVQICANDGRIHKEIHCPFKELV